MNGKRNLFLDKMRNLNNCKVRVTVANHTEPFVFVKPLPNGSYEITGGQISFLNALSESLNFEINYVYTGDRGNDYENGSSQEALEFLLKGEADLAISNFWMLGSRMEFFETSNSYLSDRIIFVVPPGRELTAFEKLIFPFSFQLWLLIWMCFLVGTFVIFIAKRSSHSIQNFIIGVGVVNPYLNMFIGFIGNSQKVLPKRNFARFLLMLFLMYSLIIRTLYQGSFYNLLKSQRRNKEVQTIDEMIHEDFKFFAYVEDSVAFEGTKSIAKRYSNTKLFIFTAILFFLLHRLVTFNTFEERDYRVEKVNSDPSFKGAVGYSFLDILYVNQMRPVNQRLKISRDTVLIMPVVIYMRRNFYLTEAINKKIDVLVAAGLVEFWQYQDINVQFLKFREPSYPISLNCSHFMGSFYILFTGSFVSFVLFIYEVSKDKFSKTNVCKRSIKKF